jgi:hypothetical protein
MAVKRLVAAIVGGIVKAHKLLGIMLMLSAVGVGSLLLLPANAKNPEGLTPVPPQGTYDGEDVPQPIEFPHNIHVKDNNINCMYCHTYARRSKVAGIPPTSKCIGCHKVIATDKERIQKLTEYWEKKQPPQWKKVHDIPDFVHFTHEKHLKTMIFDRPDFPVENVKEVCAFCHGDVENMTVAEKQKPLNMGFCVRCHIANEELGAPGDCWACHK